MQFKYIACSVALTLVSLAGAATPALEVSDEIDARTEAYMEARMEAKGPQDPALVAATEKMLDGLKFSELNASEIEKVLMFTLPDPAKFAQARARIKELIDAKTPQGAVATTNDILCDFIEAQQDPAKMDAAVERLATLFDHPGMLEALRHARATIALTLFTRATPPGWGMEHRDQIASYAAAFTNEAPPELAVEAANFYRAIAEMYGDDQPEKVQEIRKQIVASMQAAGERAKDGSPEKEAIEGMLPYLNGAFARGELLDHEAPEVKFTWSSDESFDDLKDLRGKVVVLDFWATWCGPCIASFPEVKTLVEHYKDAPVQVIGVTSLQGAHFTPQGEQIDTTGDPEKEYKLMSEYIGQRSLTWPIAFVDSTVQIEFGVDSIPHVVIIDPDGVVRHRGLNPLTMGPGEKEALIDPILKEFDLKVPERAPEEG